MFSISQHHKRAGYKNTSKPDNRSAEAQLEHCHCQKMLKPVYKQRNSGEGPLENLWGLGGGVAGGRARKKSRKGTLNEKKFLHAN